MRMRRKSMGGMLASPWVRGVACGLLALTLTPAGSAVAQEDLSGLLTAPERTGLAETTRHAEVVRFMETVAHASPLIHLTTFGYSLEGRSLPLAVVGHVEDPSPEAVRESGRTVVYLQGGIHSGEVEGKEVLLMLLREIAQGEHHALLDSLVLLVAPIFNPDGAERVLLTNRGLQHGPIAGTGTRPNAQGLNINRDHTKLDSPEGRSLAMLMRDYDPHVAADLHTTNGTRHAYHLTYSPPLHPNTHPDIVDHTRSRLFHEMTENVRSRSGWEFYYYGNVQGQGEARGWYTFDHRPRFSNNYYGLRNRIGLLSEAYSYATFEDRITATRYFVDETLRFSHENATEIRELTERVDAESIVGRQMAVRAEFERSSEPVEILMGGVAEDRNPYSGSTMLRRTDERRPEQMYEYGTFQGTVTETVPSAYLVPAALRGLLDILHTHGIRTEPAGTVPGAGVEVFLIESSVQAAGEFEGRRERTLTGRWVAQGEPTPPGSVRVPMDQPLARLAFILLEPRSDDGFVNWGMLDGELIGGEYYPILRVR